jgi:ketosteroid isomerase-like protein
MSEENVAIIREMLERFAAGDRESWREVFAEDVVWDTSATSWVAMAGVYEGHSGIERFFIDWLGTWENPVLQPVEVIDAGDSVVGIFTWNARGRTSGTPTEMTMFGVYDLKDDRVVRYRQYDSRAQALEAAGLSE